MIVPAGPKVKPVASPGFCIGPGGSVRTVLPLSRGVVVRMRLAIAEGSYAVESVLFTFRSIGAVSCL